MFTLKPVRMDALSRSRIEARVEKFVRTSEKLSRVVSRTAIRGGRVYLYHLVKPFVSGGTQVQSPPPLTEGKYHEDPYARVTVSMKTGRLCSAECQRHTGEWIPLRLGNLEECLRFIESDDAFFHAPLDD
jgi:hypothetical protein